MLRRRAIFEVCPKTTVHGFYRSDAFFIALIPIILLILLFLPSCGKRSVSVKFYKTLQECMGDQVLPKRCQEAYDQAKQEHLQQEFSYSAKVDCEQDTQVSCELISTSKGLAYKPIMQGFAVEQTQEGTNSTSTHTSYISHPVYGRSSGYWLANREPLRFTNNRTAIVTSKSSITRGFGSSFKASNRHSSGS